MKGFALSLLLMLCLSLAASTWEVKQDGSGHFTHIQDAIDAATHGDSIKVFPGTYVENIDYIGKNIFIYSLEYTTGNPAYRDSTIIDGNRSGSVVKSVTATTDCGIYGFTIQNGSGSNDTYFQGVYLRNGGGLLIRDATVFSITNCIITNNRAEIGGGFRTRNSTVFLSGSNISKNYASLGGGINMSTYGQVVFDPVRRSCVYGNIAGSGQDIIATDSRLDTYIYLDQASILPITDYYISYNKSLNIWPGSFPVIDILRANRIEENHDIYVSPQGDDTNDGHSCLTPIKSVFLAMQLVKSDSLNQKVVHLAGGTYSTNDGQFYPIGMKKYVSIIGDSIDIPILENLLFRETIVGGKSHNANIQNLRFEFGNSTIGSQSIALSGGSNIQIKNVSIMPYTTSSFGGISLTTNEDNPASYTLENVTIQGVNSRYQSGLNINLPDVTISGLRIISCNVTGDDLDDPFPIFYYHGNKLLMQNALFANNTSSNNDPNIVSIGIVGDESTKQLKLDNVLIANNQTAGAPPVFIAAFNDNPGIINNCTFANNSGANFAVQLNGNFEVNNCIFDNDTQAEIKSMGSTSQLDFNNNFIRNYPASTSFEAINNISFNDVVLSGEPGFCSSLVNDPLSYRLANSSVCRDMGTPDTLGLSLPEIDLAGNQRIFGAAIDLGCYEWNYPVGVTDILSPQALELRSFPNPFSAQHTVLLNLKRNAYLNCDIYNLRGQKVRSLADSAVGSGEQMLVWDGRDDDGKLLGSGIYFLKLRLDGKVTAVRRLVLAK